MKNTFKIVVQIRASYGNNFNYRNLVQQLNDKEEIPRGFVKMKNI